MRRGGLLLLFLFLLVPPARGQGARQEQAEVQQQLMAQRAAAALLEAEEGGVLAALELAERMARLSQARARAAERELQGLKRRLAQAEALERVAGAALREQLREMGPRLRLMDRRLRRRPLDVLLGAEDFAALVWRARALGALMEQDVKALRRVERARSYQTQAAAELASLRATVEVQHWALAEQRQHEAEQREVLVDLLRLVQAEGRESRRLIAELERAERQLVRYVAELDAGPETSGFGALRGKLPLPAAGRIEVGFGKVINPRFNTVTVQKGVDIRAPARSPVRAVADGTVVHAGWLRGYGNLLILDHGGGYHTLMAHLDTLERGVGEQVRAGEQVGTVGDTASLKGAYLYFEVRRRGQALDPADWLRLR